MKSLTAFIALLFIVTVFASCAKEEVKFQKMPDNGNVLLNCPDEKK